MGPYKFKFRKIFRNMIKSSQPYSNVLDIACADAKFREYFGNTNYTGVDISNEILTSNKAITAKKDFLNTKLILGDLASPDWVLMNQKFDLVVSTHTLGHIKDPEKKKIAIDNLIASVADDKYLIIQLNDKDIEILKPILDTNLFLLKHRRYRGVISDILENKFSENFHKSLIGNMINLILSYLDLWKNSDNLLHYKKI